MIRSEIPKTSVITRSKILDLATYEIGNAVWKESKLMKLLTSEEIGRQTTEVSVVLSSLEKLSIDPSELPGALEIARREKKTFYNSSYIYVGKRDKLTFVTEDQTLLRAAWKHIQTMSARKLISDLGR